MFGLLYVLCAAVCVHPVFASKESEVGGVDRAALIQHKIALLLSQRRAEEAESELEKSIKEFPQLAANFTLIAATLRRQGKFEQAMHVLDQWVKHCPDGTALVARADTLARAGRLQEAFDDYGDAIRKEPDNLHYRDLRGRLYERNNRYKEAFADYDYLVKHTRGADLPRQYANRGLVYYRQRNYQAAILDLDKLLAVNNDGFLLGVRIRCYMALQQHEKALRDLNKIISKDPGRVEFRAMHAEIMEKKGELQKALDEMNFAVSKSKFNPAFYTQRARLLEKLGKNQEARQDLAQVKKLKELEKERF